MNEETQKGKAERGTRGLQRSEEKERDEIKQALRKKIRSIREGHTTGGYCETEALHGEEKKLATILHTEIEELEHSQEPDAKKRAHDLKRELLAFAWKPKLVVDPNQ